MESILTFLTSSPVAAFANLSSVVGLGITIVVAIGVKQIRKHYAAMIRLPELRGQLEGHASALSNLLNDYANNAENIVLELTKIVPVLKAVKKRINWSERDSINEALERIKDFTESSRSEDRVRAVHHSLHGIMGELDQRERDSKWSA